MAIKLDAELRQWIDLDLDEEGGPCLAQPTTCDKLSATGATVALWVKVGIPGEFPGIISSRRTKTARGFQIGKTNTGHLM